MVLKKDVGSWLYDKMHRCVDSVEQKECIEWAWELLTERWHMPKDRLYVSYFGGNKEKGLEPDLEARDIWISVG